MLYVCQINFRQVIFISFLWALISYCVYYGGSNIAAVMMSVKETANILSRKKGWSITKFNLLLYNIECYWHWSLPLNKYLQSPQPPQYIYWQRNDRMVNYDDNRRDVSIETIPGPRTQSRLNIKEPQISDSGNYTCRASNTEPASIYVYVSKGKNNFTKTQSSHWQVSWWNHIFVYCLFDEIWERLLLDKVLIENIFATDEQGFRTARNQ